jgi:hypothetical protein
MSRANARIDKDCDDCATPMDAGSPAERPALRSLQMDSSSPNHERASVNMLEKTPKFERESSNPNIQIRPSPHEFFPDKRGGKRAEATRGAIDISDTETE